MSELAISVAVNIVLGMSLFGLMMWRRNDDSVRLTGADEALDRFRAHFPDAAGVVTLSTDLRSALIYLQGDSNVGFLQRHARRWNARLLGPGDIAGIRLLADGTIDLHLKDFGWPRARITIAPDAAVRCCDRLGSLSVRNASLVPARHA